jgi:hypothetical protein
VSKQTAPDDAEMNEHRERHFTRIQERLEGELRESLDSILWRYASF